MMITARLISRAKSVPTISPIRSLRCSPTYREIRICPALEKPIATKVISCSISPPIETADSPSVPTKWPTTIMSTML